MSRVIYYAAAGAAIVTSSLAILVLIKRRKQQNKIVSLVRSSCAQASVDFSSLVQIHPEKLGALKRDILMDCSKPPLWDEFNWHCTPEIHGNELCARYIFVLDALNYCFWPNSDHTGLEYEHLALGLKFAVEHHGEDFLRLSQVTQERVESWLVKPHQFPLLESRVLAIQSLGRAMEKYGDCLQWILESKNSAVELVELIYRRLPSFRDEVLYRQQRRICFYKRAQILVADVWAAFGQKNQGLGGFFDMAELTIFADYRLPQLLRQVGVLSYSNELAQKVDAKKQINVEEEIAIRACTVHAVELLKQVEGGSNLISVQIDWLLWQRGEALKDKLLPNHRVLTTFY